MDKVFDVELYGNNGESCGLSLPATDYELLDALEQIRVVPAEQPEWRITRNPEFQFLHKIIEGRNLYAVNDLSRKLDSMNPVHLAAFEGLLQMSCLRGEESTITDLLTFANSANLCDIIAEATNDAELGRYYAEYDFTLDMSELPQHVFEKLDFEKIGKERRESERPASHRVTK